ncbi:MAG: hypothetical protein OXU21_14010 [Chloroflexota bacterium]|nr:hypothetical protein [Chloroflexota bacterium]
MTTTEARPRGSRLHTLAAVGLVLAGLLTIYGRLIFEGLVLSGYDVQTYFYPYWAYASASLVDARLPLWNPHVFMGVPFLANPQSAVFYPLNWPLYLLDPARALAAALMVHVALAAIGMLALARAGLRLGWPAAATGAAAFGFSGFFAGQMEHINQVSVAAWIPLLILAIELGVAGRRRWWAATPVIVALMMLAGHPQTAYVGLTFGLAWALVAGLRRVGGVSPRGRARGALAGLSLWLIGAVGGAALAAAQILPSLELSHEGIRAGGLTFQEAVSFSLPTGEALPGLLPTFLHLPSSTEFVASVGIVGVTLAALGAVHRWRDPRVVLLVLAAFVAILLALGPATPLFGLAHRVVPGVSLFRVPARWLLIAVVALALLAAYGTEALGAATGRPWRERLRWLGVWFVVLAGLGGLSLGVAIAEPPLRDGLAWTWGLVAAIAIGFVAVGMMAPRRLYAWVAPLIVIAELAAAVGPAAIREAIPIDAYEAKGQTLPRLDAIAGSGRILSIADPSYEINDPDRAALASAWFDQLGEVPWREFKVAWKNRDILNPNLTMAYGLDTPDGYDGGLLPLSTHVALRETVIRGSATHPDALLMNQLKTVPSNGALDMLSVDVVIDDRFDTFETDVAAFDLRMVARLREPLRIDALDVPGVTGVAILASGDPSAGGVDAGRIVLTDAVRGRIELPLRRSRDDTTFVGLPNAEAAPPRDGLPPHTVLSSAELEDPIHVTAIGIEPQGGVLDVRALSLLLEDGSSVGVLLRAGRGMLVELAGDVTITRRAQEAQRIWMPTRVGVAPTVFGASRALSSPRFTPAEEAWLLKSTIDPARSNALRRALEELGVVRRREPVGLVVPEDGARLRREFATRDAWLRFDAPATAVMTEDSPERVTIEVVSEGPRMLVLNDTLYAGWEAYIDGGRTTIWQANLAQRAVLIPSAGHHTVTFEFSSYPLRVGAIVSAVAAAVWVLGALVLLAWRRAA